MLVTYSRIEPHELYHVSREGIAGGASRLLVYLNWPVALAAIVLVLLALDRLLAAGRRSAIWAAVPAVALCAFVAAPGVVKFSDLDARPVNVVPALGVALALAMTAWAVRVAGIGGAAERSRGDPARIAVAAGLSLLALPWIFAEIGVYIGDIPLLSHVFRSKQLYVHNGVLARAVHLGEHHGFVGLVLIFTALLLSRELGRMRQTGLRTAAALYLSLMIAYGLGNIANDAWVEQVVKRRWTKWELPDMTRPHLTWIWAIAIAVGAAIYWSCFRVSSRLRT